MCSFARRLDASCAMASAPASALPPMVRLGISTAEVQRREGSSGGKEQRRDGQASGEAWEEKTLVFVDGEEGGKRGAAMR